MGIKGAVMLCVALLLAGCKTTKETAVEVAAVAIADSAAHDSTHTISSMTANIIDSTATSYDVTRIIYDTAVTDSATGAHPVKEIIKMTAHKKEVKTTDAAKEIKTTNVATIVTRDSTSTDIKTKSTLKRSFSHIVKICFFMFIVIGLVLYFLFLSKSQRW